MTGPLDPPATLTPAERAIWTDTLAQVMAAGRIDRLDPNSLAAYVSAVTTHERATTLLRATDVLIDRDGKPAPNPALQVQAQAAQVIAAFARQFRLNAGTGQAPPERGQQAEHGAEAMRGPQRGRWCDEHRRYECTKDRKAGRGQCHGAAFGDTDACRMHSGKRRPDRLAVRLAEQLVPTYGAPLRISPERALLQLLWDSAGHVKWLGQRVAELEANALTWGTDRQVTRYWGEFPGAEVLEKAGPHVLLDLYDRERRFLAHVAVEIIRAGLAARMVDLAQQQGRAYAECVDGILRDLDLTPEQWQRVPDVVPRRFRELEAG
jgi:phage terminase small subunit